MATTPNPPASSGPSLLWMLAAAAVGYYVGQTQERERATRYLPRARHSEPEDDIL